MWTAPWWAGLHWKCGVSLTSSRTPFKRLERAIMSWIVAILSVFLVIACLLLILLVLIQLPKKEAGMGQAFGGGATDALFGAGSGTALTKMTKYTTGIFFVLCLLLWLLKAQEVRRRPDLEKNM